MGGGYNLGLITVIFFLFSFFFFSLSFFWGEGEERVISNVPAGSPSRGGDVAVFVFDTNQPSLTTPFYSVLVSMALSTAFH